MAMFTLTGIIKNEWDQYPILIVRQDLALHQSVGSLNPPFLLMNLILIQIQVVDPGGEDANTIK